jgi:rubrerythrin
MCAVQGKVMSILKNALDSIAIGLEDFESSDERRIISSTRNIFAGILLLFKHKLCELSPEGSDEALIKQQVLPEMDATGAVNWIGKGKKTVDVQSIKDRFESLGISVDWKRLERINKYRNDIEHYYSTLNNESVQQLISDSFIIIRDFIADELEEDPKVLLGEEYWKILVDVNEVYEKEKAACNEALERLNYYSDEICSALIEYRCRECGSGLLGSNDLGEAAEATFVCRACGNESHYEGIANHAVNEFYAYEAYLAHKDGGDTPVVDCPLCGHGAYIFHEGICVSCGDSATHECVRCGCFIPPEEISDGDLCGYCSHMVAKIMAE